MSAERTVYPVILRRWIFILLLVLGFAHAFLMLKPHIAGFYYDDGMYLLAAKSLAQRHGYFVDGMPVVKYPPLFPALLTPLWWLAPNFPQNITLFKLVPIFCFLLVLWVIYREGLRQQAEKPWLALLPIALLVIDGSIAWVNSALLSESVYTLLSLGFLFWLERQFSKPTDTFPSSLTLAALSVPPFYTRSIGITLIMAVFLGLWQRRGIRTALPYAAWSLVLILPWFAWGFAHSAPIYTWGDVLLVNYNHSYWLDLWIGCQQQGGFWQWLLNGVRALSLVTVERLFRSLYLIPSPMISSVKSVLQIGLGLALLLGGWFYRKRWFRSIPALYAGFYLFSLLLWNADKEQYWRLLIPLFPLLWLSLLPLLKKRTTWTWGALFLTLQFSLGAIHGSFQYLAAKPAGQITIDAPMLWPEYLQTFDFIRTLPKQDLILTRYGPAYMLYTQHRTWSLNLYLVNPNFGQDQESKMKFLANYYLALRKTGVRYVILEPNIGISTINPESNTFLQALVSNPDLFKPVFHSFKGSIQVYERI